MSAVGVVEQFSSSELRSWKAESCPATPTADTAPAAPIDCYPLSCHLFSVSATHFEVQYVADLARIHLSAEEVQTFQKQLEHVLEHVARLDQIEVDQVDPTAHSFPIFNVFRPDVPTASLPREVALANAPRQAQNLFVVTKVVE